MTRTVAAFAARRQFGQLLHDIETRQEQVIVERNGHAVAALVPIAVYEQWQRQRDAFFDRLEATAARASLSEEEAIDLALEGQRWARGRS
jgi:prevent-host-death family protein